MTEEKAIRVRCEAKQYIQLDDLIPLQGDLKSITKENFNKLKQSLITDGIPLGFHVWHDKDKIYIADGHHRRLALLALRDEGYHIPALPCNPVVAKNKKEAAKVVLISNSRYAGMSQESISDFMIDFELDLSDLDNLDIPDLNMDDFELDSGDKELNGDLDEVPELNKNNIHGVKEGDIWQLGDHRLMCGDSTKIEDVEKLMDGNYCDITFTSPPYNAAKNGHLTGNVSGFDKKYQQHSDELSDDDYLGLLAEFTSIAIAKSKYCFVNIQLLTHNRGPLFKYQEQFQSLIKDILIWNKKQCPPNIVKGAFNTKWEYIFCFSEDKKTRGFPCSWQGQFPNVVETESNAANEFADTHKAGFPVALPSWFIEKFDFAKTIYDPFGGTGTTMIAAEKTNRKCFMMELDPHYCSVIIERWQLATGNKAVKLN